MKLNWHSVSAPPEQYVFGSTKAWYVTDEKGIPHVLIQDIEELPQNFDSVRDPPLLDC